MYQFIDEEKLEDLQERSTTEDIKKETTRWERGVEIRNSQGHTPVGQATDERMIIIAEIPPKKQGAEVPHWAPQLRDTAPNSQL